MSTQLSNNVHVPNRGVTPTLVAADTLPEKPLTQCKP